MAVSKARSLFERLCNRAALFDRRYVTAIRTSGPAASFTFDDFPSSSYDIGGRILEAAHVRGTYFVSGEMMGKTSNNVKYYEEEQLKTAYAAGHEIGCHGFIHKKMSRMSPLFAHSNCEKNAQFVHDILGSHAVMTSFAYPYGDATVVTKEIMAKKFAACRGVREGISSGSADRAYINITSLEERHMHRFDLASIIAEAKSRKGWIVFLTHDVAEKPSPYGCTPVALEKVVQGLISAGIQILPFKTAAAYVFPKK